MNQIVSWLAGRRALTALIIVVYIFLVAWNHERVQDTLAAWQKTLPPRWIGLSALWVCVAVYVAVTLALFRDLRTPLARYWLIAGALGIAVYAVLMVTYVETVHFPQYAILAVPVFALSQSVGETVLWTTLLGAVDEGYQYAVLHKSWGVPYDFNDVTMNAVGAALGVVLMLRLLPRCAPAAPVPLWRRPAAIAAALLLCIGAVLGAAGKLRIYQDNSHPAWIVLSRLPNMPFWFYDPTWGPKHVHILHPFEGVCVILALYLWFSRLDAKTAWCG